MTEKKINFDPVAWMVEWECPPTTTVRLLADMNPRQRAYVEQHAKKITLLFSEYKGEA